jgi:hypothetical protein
MGAHAAAALLNTLHELSQSSLALSGAIMGDPAGQIHPLLKQSVEEVTRLSGIALDQAKGISITQKGIDGHILPLGLPIFTHNSKSNFI